MSNKNPPSIYISWFAIPFIYAIHSFLSHIRLRTKIQANAGEMCEKKVDDLCVCVDARASAFEPWRIDTSE